MLSRFGLLASISDFSEDIVSEAGSDSGGVSSHDGNNLSDTDSDYIDPEPSTSAFSHPLI